ncbi:MAG: hypothetical protein PHC69_09805, partial [Ruminiclostridium sp.]|nr:hypothetical protein [Ruminiclostridium sp.]
NRPPTRKNQKGSQWNEILLDNISIAKSAREMEDAGLIHISTIKWGFSNRNISMILRGIVITHPIKFIC